MKTKILTFAACMLWSGAALSSAAPANALAGTFQYGTYAACSASWQSISPYSCVNYATGATYYFSYSQNIKIYSQACNTAACTHVTSTTYTDMVYGTGRKVASNQFSCSSFYIYQLGACAC